MFYVNYHLLCQRLIPNIDNDAKTRANLGTHLKQF